METPDYGHLVCTASVHNWREGYWTLFDTPLGDAYGLGVDHHGANHTAYDHTAELLDSHLKTLRPIEIVALARGDIATGTAEPPSGSALLPSLSR